MAEELFTLDPEKIKHEVADPPGSGSYAPRFESLLEQKETFVQSIHNQGCRQILVLPPEGNEVISLRTLDVPTPKLEPLKLEEVKAGLLRRIGKAIRPTDFGMVRPLLGCQPRERRIPAAGGLV